MSSVNPTSSASAAVAATPSNAHGAKNATADHPPAGSADPTVSPDNIDTSTSAHNVAAGGLSTTAAAGTAALARIKVTLRSGLRQFPDFPSPGILFEDIMPIFATPALHADLITALELQVAESFQNQHIDVVVGLESRGFLFGPTLALRLKAGFVPVRKQGKLPGPCETAGYKKEYGEDFFQMQKGAIQSGQKVLIVDDIIATGGSAAAAGSLVKQLGGSLVGYLFLMELDFLKGRAKLDAPVHTLLTGQEEGLKN